MVCPLQAPKQVMLIPAAFTIICGSAYTVTVEVPVQPLGSVTVTEYVVVAAGVAIGLKMVPAPLKVAAGVHA